jgi:hypothetical protein
MTASLCAHVRKDGLGAPEKPENVDLELLAYPLLIKLFYCAGQSITSIVHENVYPPKVLDAGCDSLVHGSPVANVKYQRENGTAMGRDQTVERVSRPSCHDDRVAGTDGRFGEGLPETPPGTSYEPYARHFCTRLCTLRIIARVRRRCQGRRAQAGKAFCQARPDLEVRGQTGC